ncbi:hypothetical protein D3C75_578690 [compost metagenome]
MVELPYTGRYVRLSNNRFLSPYEPVHPYSLAHEAGRMIIDNLQASQIIFIIQNDFLKADNFGHILLRQFLISVLAIEHTDIRF